MRAVRIHRTGLIGIGIMHDTLLRKNDIRQLAVVCRTVNALHYVAKNGHWWARRVRADCPPSGFVESLFGCRRGNRGWDSVQLRWREHHALSFIQAMP